MPLEQIRDFLNNREISKMQHMLQNQKEAILQKKKELELMERKIDQQLVLIEDAIHSDLGRISVKHILEKRVAWLKIRSLPSPILTWKPPSASWKTGRTALGSGLEKSVSASLFPGLRSMPFLPMIWCFSPWILMSLIPAPRKSGPPVTVPACAFAAAIRMPPDSMNYYSIGKRKQDGPLWFFQRNHPD